MKKFDFQKFFDGNDERYYDAKYIITILEETLEINFDEIKAKVFDAKVIVNENQIKNYLEQKFEEENPELKQRVQKRKLDYEKSMEERKNNSKKTGNSFFNWMPLTDEEKDEYTTKFVDNIAIYRYQFEPYTLQYFNRYIEIVKNKLLTLLSIIEKIGNKNVSSIQDLMTELDIILDENKNISKEDIIRLLTPTIYNFEELSKKVEESNELSTYLTFKMSKHSLMREGLSEDEIYPTKLLQDYNLFGIKGRDNVPLSSRQEQERREKQRKNSQAFIKLLLRH